MPLLKKKLTAKNVNEKSKNGKFRYFGFFFCLQLCQTCKKKRKFLMCINVFKCRLLFKEVQIGFLGKEKYSWFRYLDTTQSAEMDKYSWTASVVNTTKDG